MIWNKNKLVGFYTVFVQRSHPRRTLMSMSLKTAIDVSVRLRGDALNSLHVKRPILCLIHLKACGSESGLFIPMILSPWNLTTFQLRFWPSPHETKHKDLLYYCNSTVKDSWLHPRNPQSYIQRDGKVFPLGVGLKGLQEFLKALLDIYPQ